MTYTYDNLGLCRHWDQGAPAEVMKWHNRALLEETFMSEWQARAQAIALQQELSSTFPSTSWQCTPSSQVRAPPGQDPAQVHLFSRPNRPTNLRVGFAEDLELWLGIEDSIKMYKIVIPLELGASGSTPWSSPATQDATSSTRPPVFAAHTVQAGNLNVHRLDTPPSWASPIMDLLHTEGEVDDDEEQPVVFVTSYFIDHRHHRYHDQPRVLRFDSDVNEWERDVRFIWEDLIDHSSAIDVVLVRPDPPFNVYGGTSATVIVHQHLDPLRAVFLITTVHIQDPRTHFQVSAHSAELQLPQERIHQLAGVEEVCRQRTQAGAGDCTIHAGTFVHPPGQHVATFHGLGLQIRIPSLLSEQEAEQNLVSRVAQQRRQRIPHLWDPPDAEDDPEGQHPRPSNPEPTESHHEPEDTVSMMARRPATLTPPQEPSLTSSASSTSSFVSEDPRRSIVFTIDGRALPVTLSWTDSSDHHSVIAQEHGIALTIKHSSTFSCIQPTS